MEGCEKFIERLLKELPDLCTVKNLVDVGVYKSEQAAFRARIGKNCPDYFRFPNRSVLYPKEAIIDYLKNNIQDLGTLVRNPKPKKKKKQASKKICTECKKEKKLINFYKNKLGYYFSKCKSCVSVINKKKYKSASNEVHN